MKVETRELTPKLWGDLEKLFGKNGACAGCWCMWWRLEEGETFEEIKGARARKRFKALVEGGKAHGILAYIEGEPIGWCSFDRRVDYSRLDRAPSLACDDAEQVWSIPCFFIKAGFRGQGVGRALLAAALAALKKRGAKIAEAYPKVLSRKLSNGEAFTGVPPLFEKQGFELVALRSPRKAAGRERWRKAL